MPVATLTTKGQITLPVEMRRKLRLEAGSKIVFDEQPNGNYMVSRKTGSVRDLKGILKAPKGFSLSIEEMDDVLAAAAAERYSRSQS